MNIDEHQEILLRAIKDIQMSGKLSRLAYQNGQQLYEMGYCHLLTSSPNQYAFKVTDEYQDFEVRIQFDNKKPTSQCSCHSIEICSHAYAAFLQTHQELSRSMPPKQDGAIKYSREGMIKRVLNERQERAKAEKYELEFADNVHGEHYLRTAHNKVYHLSFYDFEKKLGYCSCPDYQTNKLETCKHLMFAFDAFERKFKDMDIPQQTYPFLEIFRHPLHDYRISWFYPHPPSTEITEILVEYFDEKQLFKEEKLQEIHQFLEKIQLQKSVKIRPEVVDFIASYFDEQSLRELFAKNKMTDHIVTKDIYPFQEYGIQFISSKKGSILADEIGMGKTVQAIGAALYKIAVLGFQNVTILCPEPLMEHWRLEIEKWVPALKKSFFTLQNFNQINLTRATDFLIIDEAQKIDDYSSSLLNQLHQLDHKHILLITDSRIETSLMKFYAMAGLIDKYLLTPLWELSYKHCLFDALNPNKVVGYYNLEQLPKRLKNFYLRRNKTDISTQIPNADKIFIPVALNGALKTEQSSISKKLVTLIKKKSPTHYDQLQLKSMIKQMLRLGQYTTCISKRQISTPKFKEFQHFIMHKLHLSDGEKVIVFADDTRIQEQLKQFLQNQQKTVKIINDESQKPDTDVQFYITREQLQKNLPVAKHLLYFHIPKMASIIDKRLQILNDAPMEVKQNNIYIFKTANSMESVWSHWNNTKPFLLQQINDFLKEGFPNSQMSLRLREELIHELKELTIPASTASNKSTDIQMNLFGNEEHLSNITKKRNLPIEKTDNSLITFFEKIIQSFNVFDEMDQASKEQLKKGKLEISRDGEDLVIRMKPRL